MNYNTYSLGVDAGLMGLTKCSNPKLLGKDWTVTSETALSYSKRVKLHGNYRVRLDWHANEENGKLVIKKDSHGGVSLNVREPTDYWLSDPCYPHKTAVHEEWSQFCNAYWEQSDKGKKLVDFGDVIACSTVYGDGVYHTEVITDDNDIVTEIVVYFVDEDSRDDWIEDDYDEC